MQSHDQPFEAPSRLPQGAGVHALCESICDNAGKRLGGGVHAGEGRIVVQIAVVELVQDGVQRLARSTDVDHEVVGVESCAPERRVDDVRRAVKSLRRPEHLTAEAVGDHHMVADGDAEHGLPSVVDDGVAERGETARGQPGHHVGQLTEKRLPSEQRVEGGVAQELERELQPVSRRATAGAGR